MLSSEKNWVSGTKAIRKLIWYDYILPGKEKKRVDRSNASLKATSATSSKTSPTDEELDAALELVRSEEIPTSPEEKEQYFMQNLAVGEQLSAQGNVS